MDVINCNWQPVSSDGELLGTVKNLNFDEGFFGDGGGRFFGNGATGFLAKRAKDFSPLRPSAYHSFAIFFSHQWLISIPSRCASATKLTTTPRFPSTRRGLATRRATAAHQGINHGNGGNLGNSDTYFFGDLGGGMLHGDAPVDGEDDQLENQRGQDGGQEGEEIGVGALAGHREKGHSRFLEDKEKKENTEQEHHQP